MPEKLPPHLVYQEVPKQETITEEQIIKNTIEVLFGDIRKPHRLLYPLQPRRK